MSEENNMSFCVICGSELEGGAKFCTQCGNSVDEGTPETTETTGTSEAATAEVTADAAQDQALDGTVAATTDGQPSSAETAADPAPTASAFPQADSAQAAVPTPTNSWQEPSANAVEKKPIYKLWWVWVLGIFGFLILCCIASVGFVAAVSDGVNESIQEVETILEGDNFWDDLDLNEDDFDFDELFDSLENLGNDTGTSTLDNDSDLTMSEQQAIRSAESYLEFMSFSRSGLIDQLEFEGFPTEDATFAVDSLDVDWYEQAVGSAESYLRHTGFSRDGLIRQLEFEGFTNSQAVHGVNAVGL